jgi:hypothetical protein
MVCLGSKVKPSEGGILAGKGFSIDALCPMFSRETAQLKLMLGKPMKQ